MQVKSVVVMKGMALAWVSNSHGRRRTSESPHCGRVLFKTVGMDLVWRKLCRKAIERHFGHKKSGLLRTLSESRLHAETQSEH